MVKKTIPYVICKASCILKQLPLLHNVVGHLAVPKKKGQSLAYILRTSIIFRDIVQHQLQPFADAWEFKA